MKVRISLNKKRVARPRLLAQSATLKRIAAQMGAPGSAFRVEKEIPPDFLKNLYYGQYDPMDWMDADAMHSYNTRIIAHQDLMRRTLPADMLELVNQYSELLDDRGTAERKQAFAAGFSYATTLFAAGLIRPSAIHSEGSRKDGNCS